MNAVIAPKMVFTGDIATLRKSTDHWGWVDGLYLAKNDDGVAMRLYHGYAYEPQSMKLWRKLCADAELVIDVGAHTGIYSLDAYRAGAKIVLSVEPYHLNYARLIMNLRHAGFMVHGAAYCAAGEVDELAFLNVGCLTYYCATGGTVKVVEDYSPGIAQHPINVRRLDTLLHDELHSLVAVIKIDTESHGVSVLRGASRILEARPHLILECIERGMGDLLRPLGYRFWRINEDREENYGLESVPDLVPDTEFSFHSPNRFASVNGLP